MGIAGILHHPAVLAALNPWYGLYYLATGGIKGFLILGGIFLCVTGAEALYADMGHFGSKPIRAAWLIVVFPSLILNYAGQTAILIDGAKTDDNIFFQLCPHSLLIPLIILATLATIIASQAVITGAFSMTKQAIRLGWLPHLAVKQTSDEGYGQVYVGAVNWILMIVTIALTLGFKKSDNLAGAYGVAVSLTMLLTTVLLFIAMREIWKWNAAAAAALAGFFFIVDASFFGANIVKVADGGYAPLLIAASVYAVMWIWHRGSCAVARQLEESLVAYPDFSAEVAVGNIPRVPGTAVFLTRTDRDLPPVLSWHLKHNRALHKELMVLTVKTTSVPRTDPSKRLTIQTLAPDFWRGEAVFGFMEHPDIPALLATAPEKNCAIDLSDVTYYVGHETIRHKDDGKGLPRWIEMSFAFMARNSTYVGDILHLPAEQTVEIGRQVEI
jgi:KUP system potassium uptake protein